MSDPFLGEIKIVGFNYPPKGWAYCDGQIIPISQNTALFSLVGTYYGGNGVSTFALPNLQGRVPMHRGGNFTLGQSGGEESHTVNGSELPLHTHALLANAGLGTTIDPTNHLFAEASPGLGNVYGSATATVAFAPSTVSSIGGGQPHENRMPYLALNFIIALQGIFPSQN